MNNINYINVNNKKIKLLRKEDETNYSFSLRKNFIKRMSPKTKEQIEEGIRLSYIFSNMKILGCVYPAKIESQILAYNNVNKNKNKRKRTNNKN